MKILEQNPPNIEIIELVLGKQKNSIFTYGNCIYNPHKRVVTTDIEHHEAVHAKQQGDTPDGWYGLYLADKTFRLTQEIEAYGEQWLFIKENVKDTKLKDWLLENMAFALSGKEYGNLIEYGAAVSQIRNYGEK